MGVIRKGQKDSLPGIEERQGPDPGNQKREMDREEAYQIREGDRDQETEVGGYE